MSWFKMFRFMYRPVNLLVGRVNQSNFHPYPSVENHSVVSEGDINCFQI